MATTASFARVVARHHVADLSESLNEPSSSAPVPDRRVDAPRILVRQSSDAVPAWHALDTQAVLARLDGTVRGLSATDAAARLERVGPNALRLTPPASKWTIFGAQLRSVVVALLAAAAIAAWATGDPLDAAAIAFVIVLNTAIGFATELRARRAMEALHGLEVPRAAALRDGRVVDVAARDLVPGDVVQLEAGQRVPADARLLESSELKADEAPLTGESVPSEKHADLVLAADAPLAERDNMLYQSSAIVAGTGRAVIVVTGAETEVGRISAMVSAIVEERTPLERHLDTLGRRLVWATLAIGALVVALERLRGAAFGRALETGLALAVAAVPEGLPAVATIALAVGVARMARRRALVRRLAAVETLGSATVVCTDKTGTLTAGEMTVTHLVVGGRTFRFTGTGYAPTGELVAEDGAAVGARDLVDDALRIGALANRAGIVQRDGRWTAVGDPTEAALLVAARKAALDLDTLRHGWVERAVVPFSSERQWMATFHARPGDATLVALVKGAPVRIVERSTRLALPGSVVPLDAAGREELLAQNARLAALGLRVLAVAQTAAATADEAAVRELTFVGFIGMADPPAAGVAETIRDLRKAGIRTVMITGDQRLTAETIARELGVLAPGEETLDGRELAALDDAALDARISRIGAFSRVNPVDKLRIVAALQRRGDVVAMLGDGVNDAAALRKADVGVAMGGRGSDVAKEAAAVVLQDDRFATIVAAVEEGRAIYDNIRKFVFYLFSCNVAEVLVLVIAGIVGLPQPLAPLHLLWLNLVTDTFPAFALAVEPADANVMTRPPRDPRVELLTARFLRSVAGYAALITAGTLAAFVLTMRGRHPEQATTAAFMTLALAQAFHLGNARSARPVLSRSAVFANWWAVAAALAVVMLQLLSVYIAPLARMLGVQPLGAREWALVIVFATIPAIYGQALKLLRSRRRPLESTGVAAGPPRVRRGNPHIGETPA